MEKQPTEELKSLEDLEEELELDLIIDFFNTWRMLLEKEDDEKIKSGEAEKKKFRSQEKRERKGGLERSSTQILNDLQACTFDCGSDDESDRSSDESDDENETSDGSDADIDKDTLDAEPLPHITDGDKTVGRSGGAASLKKTLGSGSSSQAKQMKMKKKEKKKIMKIVQKFISNINGKENRERASVVLTKIVNESKSVGSMMGHLADKMVKNKKVFGSNIQEILKNDKTEIPRFLVTALEVVRRADNIVVEGIYRQNGNMALIQALKVDVEKNDLEKLEKVSNVHNLTGLVKLFFRELKDPLFNAEWYEKITAFVKKDQDQSKEREGRKDELKVLFEGATLENRKTLMFLVGHFDEVQKHEDKNLMGAENLAIVFGPTLSRVNPLSKDLAADVAMQNLAVRLVIEDKDCREALEQSFDVK